jgi:hypothetical protein
MLLGPHKLLVIYVTLKEAGWSYVYRTGMQAYQFYAKRFRIELILPFTCQRVYIVPSGDAHAQLLPWGRVAQT